MNTIEDNEIDSLINLLKNPKLKYKFNEESVKDFINKMTIWYELRYPCVNSDDLYNINMFINNLSSDERKFLKKPKYPRNIVLDTNNYSMILELSTSGVVLNNFLVDSTYENRFTNDDFKGIDIKTVARYFKYNVNKTINTNLKSAINRYEESSDFRDELLRTICYNLLNNDSKINGVYRCILFMNEFDVNIDSKLLSKFVTNDNIQIINQYLYSKKTETYILKLDDNIVKVDNDKLIDLLIKNNYKLRNISSIGYKAILDNILNNINNHKLRDEIVESEKTKIKKK